MKCMCRKLCCLFLGILLTIPSLLSADSTTRECVKAAKANSKACKTTCQETFKNEKIACGANPECHQACNAEYESCREEYDVALESCLDSCIAPYVTAREICKAQISCGNGNGACFQNADFRACLRPAILEKVTCSLNCRDQHKTNPDVIAALKVCAKSARSCHKACKLTPTPAPTATPTP